MESVTMAFDFKKEYKEFYMPKGTPSMFYGTAGVAYEMLRYAFPDKIQSLF